MKPIMAITLLLCSCSYYPLIKNPPKLLDNAGKEAKYVFTEHIPNGRAMSSGDSDFIVYHPNNYILLNPDYLQKYPEDIQLFIIYHEWFHIVLEHKNRKFSKFEELQKEADCMALGYADTPNVREFLKEIRGDLTHYCD